MTRVSVHTNTSRSLRLFVFDCGDCGVIFGIDEVYDERRRKDGKRFYCPNGHWMAYSETEADKLRKEKEAIRTRWMAEVDQRQAAENEAAAAKASEIRIRWRVGNGVCPCCSRTFPGLAAHVAAKHPEFLTDDLDRLSYRMVELLADLRQVTEANDAATVSVHDLHANGLTIRALKSRGLVMSVGHGDLALTERGWPLAEEAVSRR